MLGVLGGVTLLALLLAGMSGMSIPLVGAPNFNRVFAVWAAFAAVAWFHAHGSALCGTIP